MIYPTIAKLTQGKYNRYQLAIATAKCARIVTDEYCRQRETAERMVSQKETDKTVFALIDKDIRDNKAVKTAINRMMEGELVVLEADENGELKPILMSAQLAKQAEAEGAEQADE